MEWGIYTCRTCPSKHHEALSCNVCPRTEGQNIHKTESIMLVVQDARDWPTLKVNSGQAPPPHVYLPPHT